MVGVPHVRNISVRLVFESLEQARVDTEPLLAQAGLQTCDIFKDDGWVPFYSHARFIDAAAEVLNDPYFALKLSDKIHLREFGALTYIVISSKTLEDLLHNLKRYMRVVTEAWNLDIAVGDKEVVLEIIPDDPDFFKYQLATEWLLINLIHEYQLSLAKTLAPLRVCFVAPLAQNKSLSVYKKMFGCPVSFGQKRCLIILDRNDLQLPIKSSDDRLLQVLKQHCDQLLFEHEFAQSDFTLKVRKHIIDLLPSGRAKASFVADKLNMTQRTLLRRLADEGTNYSEILEAIRHELAMKYIREKRLSLKQIAYLLGYSDQSAFSVAFKRWNGCTPKAARIAS